MYSLDINFLNDRAGARPDGGAVRQQSAPSGSYAPAIAGLLVGLLLPALAGGAWLYLNNQSTELNARKQQLTANLGTLTALEAQIAAITKQATQVKAETDALAGVFNEIKPWSSMLQDIRDRIPSGVQVEDITQTDAPPATAAKGPKPTSRLEISGIAKSFNDVNDFLLTLQKSRFLIADQTQLVSAQLRDNPTQIEVQAGIPGRSSAVNTVQVKLPQVVAYKIQTNLSDIPASELIRELESKGAVGLVTRIRTLQSKGVIQ